MFIIVSRSPQDVSLSNVAAGNPVPRLRNFERSGFLPARLEGSKRLGFHGAALIVAGGAGQDEVVAGEGTADGFRQYVIESREIRAPLHPSPGVARRNAAIDAAPAIAGINVLEEFDAQG